MKREMAIVTLAAVVAFGLPSRCGAGELAELKSQLKAMQKQMAAMQKRIETLEAKEKAQIETPKDMKETGIPEKMPRWTDEVEVGYQKGSYIKTRDDKYALHLRFLLQPQYEYVDVDGGENSSTFLVKRAQLRMFGNVLDPRLKYKMMTQGRTTAAGADHWDLRDLWLDWQWTDNVQIMMGQFFVYYDHENLQPSWALPLVDRSIISANLGLN